MKDFIKNIAIFFLALCFFNLIFILSNFAFMTWSDTFKLPQNKVTLILGDSATETAINDSILSNSINLSYSADSYFYTYLKLKTLISKNPGIETVLLAFSFHNIYESIEKEWIFDDQHVHSRFGKYYPLMDINDFKMLFSHKPIPIIETFFSISKQLPANIFKPIFKGETILHLSYGGYRYLERNKLDEAIDKLNSENPPKTLSISKIEKQYLRKIVALCKNNGIQIIFVNTPKHPMLIQKRPNYVKQFYAFYNKNFATVLFLDFSKIKMPDSYYGDLTHLNFKGAKFFSEKLEREGITRLTTLYRYHAVEDIKPPLLGRR